MAQASRPKFSRKNNQETPEKEKTQETTPEKEPEQEQQKHDPEAERQSQEQQRQQDEVAVRDDVQAHGEVKWRDKHGGYADTTATLEPLMNASPQDWLGSNQDPDVLLAIPNLGVDHIGLQVENLKAHVELHAKVLDLLELHVGADVSIEKVDLQIDNVRVQAMLKVKLEKVAEIVDRVMTTIDNNPEILTNLTQGLGEGLAGKPKKDWEMNSELQQPDWAQQEQPTTEGVQK